MGLVDSYLGKVHSQMRFRGIYPINTELKIGDFGTLRGHRFIREGNLGVATDMSKMGGVIATESLELPVEGSEYDNKFSLGEARAVEFGANATVDNVVKVKAGLQVSFQSEFSAFVALSEMRVETMRNLKAVGDELVDRAASNVWAYNGRFVVTQLIRASSMVLLLSSRAGTRVELEASGDVPQIDLAKAGLSFRLVYNDTGDSQFFPTDAKRAVVTPFFWVHGVDRGPFGWFRGGFNQLEAVAPGAMAPEPPPLEFRSESDPLSALRR
ncbi:MAG: hypothetical protein K8H88_19750 [Sandaracinaceae bacterium]|nr:hypothetical protein [Sandaracinaceae bacterium]